MKLSPESWKLKAPVCPHGSIKLINLNKRWSFIFRRLHVLYKYYQLVPIHSQTNSQRRSETRRHAQNFNIPLEVALDVHQQWKKKKKRKKKRKMCPTERLYVSNRFPSATTCFKNLPISTYIHFDKPLRETLIWCSCTDDSSVNVC